ncbi:class II D-tagatose-bisphosphate aldolase non-catalytic subunit [Saccharothrix obliqua]|uniref:class II D-tagatose-bisphosphate aldolase non-catalytic subunit n=1 Tax=Saccharothrix obliqua TaxID=2861747 RepID=UPI001C5DB3A3|nr:class II D-tagatose-bisphosphate aldolase, non-catalytic subunit [Saccharothrix obliqua]MBW4717274.1 class II D-tagatose-bisphosphate aldolase, non-catalytic subunit [Saccharothrix obliqua]
MTSQEPVHVPSRVGIGPMSRNAVDATIAVAARHGQPLMLIPSRRQVEAASQGGGYVEGWDTEAFADYVRSHDPNRLVLLCRDHGGPYQSVRERTERLSGDAAMASALESYQEDIRRGFDLLHIDTSMDLDGVADPDLAVRRAVELYGQCVEYARSIGAATMFEIGFEDQGHDTNHPGEFEEQLDEALALLAAERLPKPTFVVAQTATKVQETRNVGAMITAPAAVAFTVRALVRATERRGIALKAHNCDYLDEATIRTLDAAGVHAMNIAPEFGVVETREFVAVLEELGLRVQLERFLALAYESRSWSKWMSPDTRASDYDRAVIAGHYTFNTEQFREIKQVAHEVAQARGFDLDTRLRTAVERAVEHYTTPLRTAPARTDAVALTATGV